MSEKVISDYNGYDYKKEFWENAYKYLFTPFNGKDNTSGVIYIK